MNVHIKNFDVEQNTNNNQSYKSLENEAKLVTPKKYKRKIQNHKSYEKLLQFSTSKRYCTRKSLNVYPNVLNEIHGTSEQSTSNKKLSRSNFKNVLKVNLSSVHIKQEVPETHQLSQDQEVFSKESRLHENFKSIKEEINGFSFISIKQEVPDTDQISPEEFHIENKGGENFKPLEEQEVPDTVQLVQEEFHIENNCDENLLPIKQECVSDEDDSSTVPRISRVESLWKPTTEIPTTPVESNKFPCLTESTHLTKAAKIALSSLSKFYSNEILVEEIKDSCFTPDIPLNVCDTNFDDTDYLKFKVDLSKPSGAKILEFPQQKSSLKEDDNVEEQSQNQIPFQTYKSESTNDNTVMGSRSKLMNLSQKLQLEEQIRKYVQLLTQVYLLSHGSSDFNFMTRASKIFLSELKIFASLQIESNKSVFNAYNLDDALKIVIRFEKLNTVLIDKNKEIPKKRNPVPILAKRTIAMSNVFMYPELLPTNGFQSPLRRKVMFNSAEDHLIAMGLEQFSSNFIGEIRKFLLPSKTVTSIKVRIKNCLSSKTPADNPIKYYYIHKVSPPTLVTANSFDANKVKAPSEYPPDVLPTWMAFYCKVASGDPMFVYPDMLCNSSNDSVSHSLIHFAQKEATSSLIPAPSVAINILNNPTTNSVSTSYTPVGPKKVASILPAPLVAINMFPNSTINSVSPSYSSTMPKEATPSLPPAPSVAIQMFPNPTINSVSLSYTPAKPTKTFPSLLSTPTVAITKPIIKKMPRNILPKS